MGEIAETRIEFGGCGGCGGYRGYGGHSGRGGYGEYAVHGRHDVYGRQAHSPATSASQAVPGAAIVGDW